jgi:hypothetical protein
LSFFYRLTYPPFDRYDEPHRIGKTTPSRRAISGSTTGTGCGWESGDGVVSDDGVALDDDEESEDGVEPDGRGVKMLQLGSFWGSKQSVKTQTIVP